MKTRIIEAILYLQGEKGVSSLQLQNCLKLAKISEARKLLKDFAIEFNRQKRGILVVEFDDIFKFVTAKDLKPFIIDFVSNEKKYRLSNSSIEVAAIIAYKQPVTRSTIAQIRGGINSDYIVGSLLAKGIIEELGTASTPGNPTLYGVTSRFFDYFKLRSAKDLPKFQEFDLFSHEDQNSQVDNFDLFSSQRENQK
ncbi:segregation/condensation protein B [Mesomycoplasma hyopneumoniae]|uniref:Segregation and condensation protein B n=3 Tax=Mesomycoplasma hyopneumoniae TaxID=2099 RepID=E4QTT9_MESH1|nr:SMC-Scp complex subunit ScpB [Mesomycoplasma hyopneumoniae]ADQ90831.1 segregation and condensation protein B [Mesomycoplasma hyopneumoniae 168]AGM22408.1 segregation and condensation protein B [Mesomycoplasma hyopneumoniae 168-L]ASU14021.1 Segregation and condensation protein B [Mesomycoplasma hyopneumoniae]MXR33463.1 segregation/condensation protein B [Mesomycoplasma hyopneumoniae]MXR44235.1 segregation/condensation protein B [Mesomycoplasma hyopneumoniae]